MMCCRRYFLRKDVSSVLHIGSAEGPEMREVSEITQNRLVLDLAFAACKISLDRLVGYRRGGLEIGGRLGVTVHLRIFEILDGLSFRCEEIRLENSRCQEHSWREEDKMLRESRGAEMK